MFSGRIQPHASRTAAVVGLPFYVLEDALKAHSLERVLPAWRLFSLTLRVVALPTRRHLPTRTRAFLDFLVQVFGDEDRDPWLAAAGCETQVWPCAGQPTPAPGSAPAGGCVGTPKPGVPS